MSSYKPRTSFGEHQFFVYIKPQDAVIVYLPIVPVILGDVEVSVRATTLIASDRVTRTLHVEVMSFQYFVSQSWNFVVLIVRLISSRMLYHNTDISQYC